MKKILLALLLFAGSVSATMAQTLNDVVYLKDGSVIHGIIVEQVPNESVKVKTADGSLFVCKYENISKITKEEPADQPISRGDYWRNGAKRGYKAFIGAAIVGGTDDYGRDRLEFSTIHGYQFNSHIFLGAGMGVNYYTTDNSDISMPVFGAFRVNILNSRITPFIGLRMGYSFFDMEGVYFSSEVGCRFGLRSNNAINISLGFENQLYEDKYEISSLYSYSSTEDCCGLALKVAWEF